MNDDTTGRADDAALVVSNVHKRYGGVRAVDDVSLTVRTGEFFGLLGPNGAGKTTLIELMEGLRQPDAGSVTLLGSPPWPRNVALLPKVGVQTQKSAFFARLTAREHLETVAELYRADLRGVPLTLARVGLADHANQRVEDLSVGLRQRLAIAAALVHDPELLFMDEPTAALDPQARRDLLSVLRGLKGEGRTIVYTTHHLDEAQAICDRIAIIVGGRLVALDTPRALVNSMKAPTRLLVPAGRLSAEQARGIAGVDQVTVEEDALVIETTAGGPVLLALSEVADLDGVRTRVATLEDVYFGLTDKEPRS